MLAIPTSPQLAIKIINTFSHASVQGITKNDGSAVHAMLSDDVFNAFGKKMIAIMIYYW